MPRKLAEAAVRMRRASARLDVPPPSARRFASSNPLTSLLPDVILGELGLCSHASISPWVCGTLCCKEKRCHRAST